MILDMLIGILGFKGFEFFDSIFPFDFSIASIIVLTFPGQHSVVLHILLSFQHENHKYFKRYIVVWKVNRVFFFFFVPCSHTATLFQKWILDLTSDSFDILKTIVLVVDAIDRFIRSVKLVVVDFSRSRSLN